MELLDPKLEMILEIDFLTAIELVALIGEIKILCNADKLVKFFGITHTG